jgi:acetoin utilization deacetylase AcuC-like enzyme
MLIFDSDAHLGHHSIELDGGVMVASWETPKRVEFVRAALGVHHERRSPGELDMTLVARVHDADYVKFLATAWDRWIAQGETGAGAMGICWPARRMSGVAPTSLKGQLGYYSFAADCAIMPGTWDAAVASAAIASSAAGAVSNGAPAAFGLCRPPGHHASRDQFGGYCYLNNAAIAAERLLAGGASRVAIVDVDYHHGNGTQDIFYDRSDVVFCSIHADPLSDFPYHLGHADEHGRGPGEGFNMNRPMCRGTDFASWSLALTDCLSLVRSSSCDALVVSLGVDAFEHDPISHFRLSTGDFHTVGRMLASVGLPSVYVLEGGYAVEALGHNVVAVLNGHNSP